MRFCMQQHDNLVEDLKATLGPQNFSTILDFQPFPSYFADIGVQRGGNMLGLERSPRNKILFVSGVTLRGPDSAQRHPQVYQKLAAMFQRIEAYAMSVGSSEGFVYLPYADSAKNPLGSYGPANVKHMKEVALKYDPDGFFQRRVPGGFKLDRV
jgi:hypothetical protein